jgi:hypothetical protein
MQEPTQVVVVVVEMLEAEANKLVLQALLLLDIKDIDKIWLRYKPQLFPQMDS